MTTNIIEKRISFTGNQKKTSTKRIAETLTKMIQGATLPIADIDVEITADNQSAYLTVVESDEMGGGGSLIVAELDGTPSAAVNRLVFNGLTSGVRSESVQIIDSVAYINCTPPPAPLQGNLSCSSPRFNARESEDTTPVNTFHEVSAGSVNDYTINDSSFQSAPADFGFGSVGVLTLLLNGSTACTIDLGAMFNEANRTTAQVMSDYDNGATVDGVTPFTGGNVTISAVRSHTTGIFSDAYQECTLTINFFSGGGDSTSLALRSGYNTVQLVHSNGPEQTNVLELYYDYDTEITPNQPEPTVTNIALDEGTPVIKYLSGVRYYDAGSTFLCDGVGHDLFDNVYHVSDRPITYDDSASGSAWGINETSPLEGILYTNITVSGVSTPPVFHDTMTITDFPITVPTEQYNMDARIRLFARDPYQDPWDNIISASNNFLIESHTASSTRTIENFYEEQWRCPVLGNFDLVNQKSWNSVTHVNNNDAVFTNGGCERNVTDWTIFQPDQAGQPDYSSGFMQATTTLIREFQHNGNASSGFTLVMNGTYTSLEMKLAKAYDGTASGGTEWVDMTASYSFADWNNGDPTAPTGCHTGGDHYTFGSNNINNCGDTVYIRVTFTAGQRITGPWQIIFD